MFSGLLIANSIKIIDSTDKTLIGISGRIVDETKNTLVLLSGQSRIVVPKSVVSFELKDNWGKTNNLVGSELISSPQERINKV